MSKIFKKHTKRVLCKKRYKVEKKIRDHHRKVKKQAKKNPNKSMKPKDPGIPNSLPFKDDIIREVVEKKKRVEELREKQKEDRKNLKMINRGLIGMEADAKQRTEEYDRKEEAKFSKIENTHKQGVLDQNQNAYYREFQKVVEASDVVIEVLDARDPIGTRCSTVEKSVVSSSDKKLILVLNKIDLVPRANLLEWLKYLRNYFPTVPFKASTQNQKMNLARNRKSISQSSQGLLESSSCLGAEALMKVIGSYSRSGDIRKSITVGVVGFPNVGKSSLINSLKRRRACIVGATPGITKLKQEIQLDKHIKLLDSPGVVLASASKDASDLEKSAIALKNATQVEKLEDPMTPAENIIMRADKEQIMRFYKLPNFKDPHEFLCLFAKRIGRLKKGGVPHIRFAARKLIQDWNMGKIKYFTQPPEPNVNNTHIDAQIMETLSQPFDLEALFNDQENELKGLKVVLPSEAFMVKSTGTSEAVNESIEGHMDDDASDDYESLDENIAEENMDTHDDKTTKKTIVKFQLPSQKKAEKAPKQRLKSSRLQVPKGVAGHHESEEGDRKVKSVKKQMKQLRRNRKRIEKTSTKLSENLNSALNLGTTLQEK